MSDPARILFSFALENIEDRPIPEQIKVFKAISDLTISPDESDVIDSHVLKLKSTLEDTEQLKLGFDHR